MAASKRSTGAKRKAAAKSAGRSARGGGRRASTSRKRTPARGTKRRRTTRPSRDVVTHTPIENIGPLGGTPPTIDGR